MISVNLNLQNFKNASWNKIKTQGEKLKIQEKTQGKNSIFRNFYKLWMVERRPKEKPELLTTCTNK